MNLYFSNPLGWLGLSAILPLVYLHFFRRRTRREIVNTLFLIDKSTVNREAGNIRDRWRHSMSFWFQVLVLILLSWLLSQPRWIKPQAVGKIAFVLDSSASLSAFREEVITGIREVATTIENRLSTTDFTLLETGGNSVAIYNGRSVNDLIGSTNLWSPTLGSHSVGQSILDAHQLVGPDGFVVFVSDRENQQVLDETIKLLVGKSIENVGIGGARAFSREGTYYWRAVVRNYGNSKMQREWWLQSEGSHSPSRAIELGAGQSIVLEGMFPEGADSVAISLSRDAFTFDDYAPIVVERGKRLVVGVSQADENRSLITRIVESVTDCQLTEEVGIADLLFDTIGSAAELRSLGTGVFFVSNSDSDREGIVRSILVPENHRLNAELSWDGLYTKGGSFLKTEQGDEVILWRGSEALIFIRGKKMVFNFSIQNSNLDRLPAFVLLVSRFLEDLRAEKPAMQVLNSDTGQVLDVAFSNKSVGGEILTRREASIESYTFSAYENIVTPSEPAFFEVKQEAVILMKGAARFSDVRESDFREAISGVDLELFDERLVEEYYDDDFYSPVWLLCIGGVMFAGWFACYKENL